MDSYLNVEALPEESLIDEFIFCELLIEKLMQNVTILNKNV